MEMRGLAEFLFLICDEGNELIEELLGGPLIRPWSNKRKASDSSNPNHGHGNPDEGNADSSASKEGANVKSSSSKDGHNAKSSSSKEVNIPDLAAALRSILGSKWEPTPEPSLLRVTNPNLSSMTMQPEPERRDQPYNHRKGPTEDNLMNMSKQEYLDTRFDQDFYARSPAQLAAMTHEDEPLWKRGPTRDDRLKALATTPKWKKLLSDKHYIDSLFVGSKELDIFNQALILARNALAKAEECAQSLENGGKLATRMMADYDAFEENVNEMEWRILNGGFKEQENIVEGESEGWWSGGNGRGEMEGVVKDEGKGKGKEEGYVGKGKGKA